ncbi:hypothetical protein ACWFRM_41240, partial [Streptomyces sp. NPDC055144]
VIGQAPASRAVRRRHRVEVPRGRRVDASMVELAAAVEEVLLGLGDDIAKVENTPVPAKLISDSKVRVARAIALIGCGGGGAGSRLYSSERYALIVQIFWEV